MKKHDNKRQDLSELSPQAFDLIKLEAQLLDQRIAHFESLQYRLRQFSITLWAVLLGVWVGVAEQKKLWPFWFAMSALTPALFMYLDARYASYTQNIRSRRARLIYFVNTAIDTFVTTDKTHLSSQVKGSTLDDFPILDLTGELTLSNDPQTIYRRSLLVKLTRTMRLVFYGPQLLGSSLVISNYLAQMGDTVCYWYYLITAIFPALFLVLFGLRRKRKRGIRDRLPDDYPLSIDEVADYLNLLEADHSSANHLWPGRVRAVLSNDERRSPGSSV